LASVLHLFRPEDQVEKRTLICVAAAFNLAVAGAACSNARGNEGVRAGAGNGDSGDTVTIAGCLSAGQDGRFALTAAPGAAAATTAARAVEIERDTHTYVLTGGNDLQSHVGKRVEVTGTLQGKKQEAEQTTSKETEASPNQGGKDTPTVKTNESVDIEVRQLNVRDVRDVAPTCVVNP
jgi:hypothetical protein